MYKMWDKVKVYFVNIFIYYMFGSEVVTKELKQIFQLYIIIIYNLVIVLQSTIIKS